MQYLLFGLVVIETRFFLNIVFELFLLASFNWYWQPIGTAILGILYEHYIVRKQLAIILFTTENVQTAYPLSHQLRYNLLNTLKLLFTLW